MLCFNLLPVRACFGNLGSASEAVSRGSLELDKKLLKTLDSIAFPLCSGRLFQFCQGSPFPALVGRRVRGGTGPLVTERGSHDPERGRVVERHADMLQEPRSTAIVHLVWERRRELRLWQGRDFIEGDISVAWEHHPR